MKLKLTLFTATSLLFSTPVVTYAAFETLEEFMRSGLRILNLLIVLSIAAAILIFFYGLVKFIARVGGSTQAVEQGKQLMVWGIIVIFIMVTLWGIIFFLQNQLGIQDTNLFQGAGE